MTALKDKSNWIWGIGRRKTSVARVRVKPGKGELKINDRNLKEFFHCEKDRIEAMEPFTLTDAKMKYDIHVSIAGGGPAGQAGAMKLGIARALSKASDEYALALRQAGLLTRDARMKERKKYGQKGARARFQYSKR